MDPEDRWIRMDEAWPVRDTAVLVATWEGSIAIGWICSVMHRWRIPDATSQGFFTTPTCWRPIVKPSVEVRRVRKHLFRPGDEDRFS
jgi:hypothetical protein